MSLPEIELNPAYRKFLDRIDNLILHKLFSEKFAEKGGQLREYNPCDLVKIGNTVCKIIRREGSGYRISNNDMCYDRWVGEDLIEPYKEDGVQNPEEVINAKGLLELNACEDGFKWFVRTYGKRDIVLKDLDDSLKLLEKTSYRQWLHEKFPQLKKKERTFKVGDKFSEFGYTFMLARINGDNLVTLVATDGQLFSLTSQIVKVKDANHITEEEMTKINFKFGDNIHPL